MLASRTVIRPSVAFKPSARCSRKSTVVPRAGMVLYGNPRSRSKVVEWYLKELGADFEIKELNMADKDHKSDWFLQVNPFGKVPAFQDGNVTIFESGAILMYVAEKVGGADSAAKRAELNKWIYFANSTMFNGTFLEQFRETQLPVCMQPLEELLGKQDYILGNEISAADVAVGSNLLYLPMFVKDLDLSPYPNVQKYIERLQARPACTIKPAPVTAAA